MQYNSPSYTAIQTSEQFIHLSRYPSKYCRTGIQPLQSADIAMNAIVYITYKCSSFTEAMPAGTKFKFKTVVKRCLTVVKLLLNLLSLNKVV